MQRWIAVIAILFGTTVQARQTDGGGGGPQRVALRDVTLEQIMADPDWIARSPERPYWSDDGAALYFSRKREGSEVRDLWRVDVQLQGDGTEMRYVAGEPRQLTEAERAEADVRAGDLSEDRQWKVFTRDADIFLRNLETGETHALTKTAAGEFGGRFMVGGVGDRRIMFQRDGAVLARDLETGLEEQLVDLRFEKEPEDAKDEKEDFLTQQQARLFEFVKKAKQQREESKQRDKEDKELRAARVTPVVYMGAEAEFREASVSPTGEWVLVRTAKKGARDAKRDTMPAFVTEDGYVRASPARPKVGTSERRGEELYLVDLRPGRKERRFKLDLAVLPGIADDPLKEIREEAAARKKEAAAKDKDAKQEKDEAKSPEAKEGDEKKTDEKAENKNEEKGEGRGGGGEGGRKKKNDEPKPRAVVVGDVEWSDDGSRTVVQVYSLDNKDRWVASVDLEERALEPLEHMHDDAWLNGRFSSLGWLKDNQTIWYLSEETGYSQLFTLNLPARFTGEAGGGKRSIVGGGGGAGGQYEVSDVQLSRDGSCLYFTANSARPGVHELYRVQVSEPAGAAGGAGGASIQQLTRLGGENDAVIAPNERGVAILHSDTTTPPELYVQPMPSPQYATAVPTTRVTRTVTTEYSAIEWIAPEVIGVPGRDGRTIWARVFEKTGRAQAKKPIVVFVHGAGYLQDAHEGWSHYFREHLFHNLLCERGYIVIAPDYRASAGYGRDWRTAIYRRMGEPELDDVQDCVAWLAKERNADSARVGVYGGSYGGFLSLMAMFTRGDEYLCGAALRPVTDWAHYNDGYTANILNTPDADPIAYEKSSPIEYAAGLRGRLLICHGMLDDNVFFQDTVRLAQRLIELKKENWEVAMYPIESHGFREATSWLDEYRRIDKLFRETLESAPASGNQTQTRGP